jgi:hypothetical protein
MSYQDYQNQLAISIKNHERIIAQLRTFLIQRKDVQNYIFNDLFVHYLDTQMLLKEIMNKDMNIDTITKYNSGISKLVHDDEEDFMDEDEDEDDDTTNNIISK